MTLYAQDSIGREIDIAAATELMDAEISAMLCDDFGEHADNPSAFLATYARMHREKYGEPFAPFIGAAW